MSEPLRMVAALYVDLGGPYPHIPGVECWGLPWRDAMRYEGPHPVVAHPPCGPWGKLSHLYEGSEQRLALKAVLQVREFGGVLEHPAHSKLWRHCELPKPGKTDVLGYYCVEVRQCDWGHPARKATWLYLCGVPESALVSPDPKNPTHWCSGGGTGRGKTPPGIKVCSAQQRRRTPVAFAEYLVSLARSTRNA